MIHNGICFTVMPARGEVAPAEDKNSWKPVHFIRHLPQLTLEELDQMKGLNPTTKKNQEEEAAFDSSCRETMGQPHGSIPATITNSSTTRLEKDSPCGYV